MGLYGRKPVPEADKEPEPSRLAQGDNDELSEFHSRQARHHRVSVTHHETLAAHHTRHAEHHRAEAAYHEGKIA